MYHMFFDAKLMLRKNKRYHIHALNAMYLELSEVTCSLPVAPFCMSLRHA